MLGTKRQRMLPDGVTTPGIATASAAGGSASVSATSAMTTQRIVRRAYERAVRKL
jgi:hypothetical protein